jgi:hypothetical protein
MISNRIRFGLSAIPLVLSVLASSSAPAAGPTPGLNVTVTNTPLPVTTTEAFVRTPVIFKVDSLGTPSSAYTVPAGFRLVVESVSLIVQCPPPFNTQGFGGFLLQHNLGNGLAKTFEFALALQNQSTDPSQATWVASQSVRFTLDPTDLLYTNVNCLNNGAGGAFGTVLGYLVSVNSPSLAP